MSLGRLYNKLLFYLHSFGHTRKRDKVLESCRTEEKLGETMKDQEKQKWSTPICCMFEKEDTWNTTAITAILEKFGKDWFCFQRCPLITEAQKYHIISTFDNDARETALEIDSIFRADRERGASNNGKRKDDCFETIHRKLQDFLLYKMAKQATLGMLIKLELIPNTSKRLTQKLIVSGVDCLVEDFLIPEIKETFKKKHLSQPATYCINYNVDDFIKHLTSMIAYNLKISNKAPISSKLRDEMLKFLPELDSWLQGELNKKTKSEVNTALREIKEVFAQDDTTADAPLVSLRKSRKVAAAKPYQRELEIPLSSSEDSEDGDSEQDEDGEQEKLGYREIKEAFVQHDTTANAPLVSLKKSRKVATTKPYPRELELSLSSSEDSEDGDSEQDEDGEQEKLGYNWNKDLFMILATTLVNKILKNNQYKHLEEFYVQALTNNLAERMMKELEGWNIFLLPDRKNAEKVAKAVYGKFEKSYKKEVLCTCVLNGTMDSAFVESVKQQLVAPKINGVNIPVYKWDEEAYTALATTLVTKLLRLDQSDWTVQLLSKNLAEQFMKEVEGWDIFVKPDSKHVKKAAKAVQKKLQRRYSQEAFGVCFLKGVMDKIIVQKVKKKLVTPKKKSAIKSLFKTMVNTLKA